MLSVDMFLTSEDVIYSMILVCIFLRSGTIFEHPAPTSNLSADLKVFSCSMLGPTLLMAIIMGLVLYLRVSVYSKISLASVYA